MTLEKVQPTVIGAVKKKKKFDDDDDDDSRHKKKKRRKVDEKWDDEFSIPDDYLEKRRSGRSRGHKKNYNDDAVPNFVDSAGEEDNFSAGEGTGLKFHHFSDFLIDLAL